jgi:O-antigen/teichoic acid export membrane protein
LSVSREGFREPLGEPHRSRITRDTLVTVVAQLAGVAATLLLTPVQLSRMGYTDYGLVSLAVGVVGVFSFLDYGISWSALRYLPGLRGSGAHDEGSAAASLLASLALGIGLALATAASALLALSYAFGRSPFGLRPGYIGVVVACVVLFPALMVTNVLSNVARALGQFRSAAIVFALYFVSTNIIWALAAGRPHDVELVLGWQILFSLLSGCFWFFRIRRTGFPSLRFLMPGRRRIGGVRRPMFVFAGFAALTGLSSTLFFTADKLAFAAGGGVHNLPLYTIVAALCGRIGIVSAALTSVIFPRLSAAHTAADLVGYAHLSSWAIRATAIVTASLASGLFWAGGDFLTVWISASFADHSTTILRLLVVGFAFEAVGQLGYSANDARGLIRRSMFSGFACALFGLVGAGIGTALWGLSAGAALFATALAVHGAVGLVLGFGWPRLAAFGRALEYVVPPFLVVGAAEWASRAAGNGALTSFVVAATAALGVLVLQTQGAIRRRLRSARR